MHKIGREEEERMRKVVKEEKSPGKDVPETLKKYWKNAPLKKLHHPLEENIFSTLLITLIAIGVALLIGIPVLIICTVLLILTVCIRYIFFALHSMIRLYSSIATSRSNSNDLTGRIFSTNRLAFANDVRWLGVRSHNRAQSILHTLLVFQGSMDVTSLRNLVQTRVLRAETFEGDLAYPRLLHRIIPVLGGWKWEMDPNFDISNHIFQAPLEIKTDKQIKTYVQKLFSERMSLENPPWEIRIVPNYGGQKDTLAILRVHQCLADGMTLVRILSHSLADKQQLHIPQRPHFAGLSFGFNVIRALIVGPLTVLLWFFAIKRDTNIFTCPSNLIRSHQSQESSPMRKTRQRRPSLLSFKRIRLPILHGDRRRRRTTNHSNKRQFIHSDYEKRLGTPSQIYNQKNKNKKAQGSTWYTTWAAPISVPKVTRIKQIMRSSFNDVLLSAAAGSARLFLQKTGVPCPHDIKVIIPVDLRNDITTPKPSARLGCKVASVLTKIPSGIEGSIPRLWATRHRLDELKASADPVVAYGLTTFLINILPKYHSQRALDCITDKASMQFCNLPGPTTTLMVGKFALKGIYPIYPPSGKVRVAISAFTYADQVHITVMAHKTLRFAGPSLLSGIISQIEQLSKQLSQRRVPGESRRSMRRFMAEAAKEPPTKQIHVKLQKVQQKLQRLSTKIEEEENDNDLNDDNNSLYGMIKDTDRDAMVPPEESHSPSDIRSQVYSLKNEYTELMGELRRRSSIIEGNVISFEDQDSEDEYRKPRKRALSVVSFGHRRGSMFSALAGSLHNASKPLAAPEEYYDEESHPSPVSSNASFATSIQNFYGKQSRRNSRNLALGAHQAVGSSKSPSPSTTHKFRSDSPIKTTAV